MDKDKVVDSHYAKSEDYRETLKKIEAEGKCPFCPDNFKYHPNPILKKIGSWFITRAGWPYKNTQHHFLVIGERHKERLEHLQAADWGEVAELVEWAIDEYKVEGGGFALRFGATEYTGATVCHLHFHLVVPEMDPETGRAKTVNFPIG